MTAPARPHFYSDADLAEIFGVTEGHVQRTRIEKKWPHLKIGRYIRYTPEHLAEIEKLHTRRDAAAEQPKATTGGLPGQTTRSASRRTRGAKS